MFKLFAALSLVALGSAVAWVRTSGATTSVQVGDNPAGVPPKAQPQAMRTWVAFTAPIGKVSRQVPPKISPRLHVLLTGNHRASGLAFDIVQGADATIPASWYGSAPMSNGDGIEMWAMRWQETPKMESLRFWFRCTATASKDAFRSEPPFAWNPSSRPFVIDNLTPFICHADPIPESFSAQSPVVANGQIVAYLLGVQATE